MSTALLIPGRCSNRDFTARLSNLRSARRLFPPLAGELFEQSAEAAGYPSRVAGGHPTGRHVAGHDAAGADDAAIANVTPGRMITPPPTHTPLPIRIGPIPTPSRAT
jgi:hypothetical protein